MCSVPIALSAGQVKYFLIEPQYQTTVLSKINLQINTVVMHESIAGL